MLHVAQVAARLQSCGRKKKLYMCFSKPEQMKLTASMNTLVKVHLLSSNRWWMVCLHLGQAGWLLVRKTLVCKNKDGRINWIATFILMMTITMAKGKL